MSYFRMINFDKRSPQNSKLTFNLPEEEKRFIFYMPFYNKQVLKLLYCIIKFLLHVTRIICTLNAAIIYYLIFFVQ